jgi:hypothetical protein
VIWADKWRALARWADRLPWWQQIVLLPPLTPLVLVAAGCLCPRAMISAGATLVAVYTPLICWGMLAISWTGVLLGLGNFYAWMVAIGLLSVLQAWYEQTMGRGIGKDNPVKRPSVSSCLWDREIDG